MKTSIVILFGLIAFVPTALSVKCYVCANTKGNCKEGEQTCPGDQCLKITGKPGDAVQKTCGSKMLCDAAEKVCKASDKCTALCCKGNLCNSSSAMKAATWMVVMAPLIAVGKYMM